MHELQYAPGVTVWLELRHGGIGSEKLLAASANHAESCDLKRAMIWKQDEFYRFIDPLLHF